MEIQHRCRIRAIVFCCMLLVLLLLVSNSHSTQEESDEEGRLRNKENPSKWKQLRLSSYWEAIKNKCYDRLATNPFYPFSFLPFSKPNTDFRGKVDKEEGGAIVKSIEEAKETVDESAKTAANMATEKLKNTFSHNNHHPQDEL